MCNYVVYKKSLPLFFSNIFQYFSYFFHHFLLFSPRMDVEMSLKLHSPEMWNSYSHGRSQGFVHCFDYVVITKESRRYSAVTIFRQ